VWDLRSRALEQFDLPAVVSACSRQLTDGTCVEVKVSVNGSVRRLPDVIEDNLLRIAQEALTNAIKHSGGTTANISLDYQPRKIVLEIRDNGQGFAADQCDGPLNGHFGLLGISERVKRLNGQVTIESLPASGTTVRVEIPLEPEEIQLPVLAGRNL
jgi:signal transduction histidine kinase